MQSYTLNIKWHLALGNPNLRMPNKQVHSLLIVHLMSNTNLHSGGLFGFLKLFHSRGLVIPTW